MTKRPGRRRVWTAAGAAMVVAAATAGYLQPVGRDFDPALRRAFGDEFPGSTKSGNPRQHMADLLVARGALLGLHRDAVVAMLGPGGVYDMLREARLEYFLGSERGLISMDGEVLTIDLATDADGTLRVTKCYIRRT